MKIFTLQNFRFPAALHLQIFKEAFNSQLQRKVEDLKLCSLTNTHGERFRKVQVWRCILLHDTQEVKVKV